MSVFNPAYLALSHSGELAKRVERAWKHLENCDLCARCCSVNRLQTTKGSVCKTGVKAVVSSFSPHHGEEDPLRGSSGSGTIFFSHCNLQCEYCQNSEISQDGFGGEIDSGALAEIMLKLQELGCHNINFVSPSHVVAQILAAVEIAAKEGLRLPLVYNTGGYDSQKALLLLDGVVDIYMPDMKYGNSVEAWRYSHAADYTEVNFAAVKEMHRQVGDLTLDESGIAKRGLLVRHLVLPNSLAGSKAVFKFLAEEISENTYINIMDQYRPSYRAARFEELKQVITREEHRGVVEAAKKFGLNRLDSRRFW